MLSPHNLETGIYSTLYKLNRTKPVIHIVGSYVAATTNKLKIVTVSMQWEKDKSQLITYKHKYYLSLFTFKKLSHKVGSFVVTTNNKFNLLMHLMLLSWENHVDASHFSVKLSIYILHSWSTFTHITSVHTSHISL